MAAVPKVLYRGELPFWNTPTAVTVPAGKQWIITNIVVNHWNTSGAVSFIVDVGGIRFLGDMPLTPKSVFTLDCSQVVEAGKTISVGASAASTTMTMHISGVEMDV